MSKRWPVGLGIVAAIAAGRYTSVATHHFWLGAPVYVATGVAWAVALRYVGGLPWSRILRGQEPSV